MPVTRQQLTLALQAAPRRLAYPFGCSLSCGFGADYIGLLSVLMTSLKMDCGVALCRPEKPHGFAIEQGWNDYFEPIFLEVHAPLMQHLNRHPFPLDARLPVLRWLAGLWLRRFSRPRSDYFAFDRFSLPDPHAPPALFKEAGDWLQARAALMRLLWVYNAKTRRQVDEILAEITLPDKYYSVCIRRGDKHIEHDYVGPDRYVSVLTELADASVPIFVTSDDYSVVEALRAALPGRRLMSLTPPNASGYVHVAFRRQPARQRWLHTVRFFAQLECLWNAELFIGSATTNVSCLVNAYRGGQGILWLD